jgi:hypothetical protein
MRILNVADFNWMTGAKKDTARLSLFDICRKFSLAATRADHLVVEFSDRAVDRQGSPLRLKGLGRSGKPPLPAGGGRTEADLIPFTSRTGSPTHLRDGCRRAWCRRHQHRSI